MSLSKQFSSLILCLYHFPLSLCLSLPSFLLASSYLTKLLLWSVISDSQSEGKFGPDLSPSPPSATEGLEDQHSFSESLTDSLYLSVGRQRQREKGKLITVWERRLIHLIRGNVLDSAASITSLNLCQTSEALWDPKYLKYVCPSGIEARLSANV